MLTSTANDKPQVLLARAPFCTDKVRPGDIRHCRQFLIVVGEEAHLDVVVMPTRYALVPVHGLKGARATEVGDSPDFVMCGRDDVGKDWAPVRSSLVEGEPISQEAATTGGADGPGSVLLLVYGQITSVREVPPIGPTPR